jgi:hypothetical protein
MIKQSRPAVRDILMALSLKFALFLTLYGLFFSPAHRPAQDSTSTANAVIGHVPQGTAPND